MCSGGCSSVGRASAFQAEGREFESRRPLQSKAEVGRMKDEKTCNYSSFRLHPSSFEFRPRSSGVERLLGKEEVMSSNLIAGSRKSVLFRGGRCPPLMRGRKDDHEQKEILSQQTAREKRDDWKSGTPQNDFYGGPHS